MDALAVFLGEDNVKFPIIRKDQSAKKPNYPFGAYKVLSVSGNRNNRVEVENPDPTKVTDRYSKINTDVISLSFYINETNQPLSIDLIHELAERAIGFIQILGRDQFRELGVTVELIEPNVTDRTTYIEPIYEYQVGFDFRIKSVVNLDNTLDAVDLDATVEGVEFVSG
ncbi:MAG: hypothetical protein IPL26_19640 [Leptospiraceae bacterium]|nr:hypothetical protein [Leptospiraceae bacterium]